MEVTFGIKAHSGWAALVVLGKRDEHVLVVDRRRIELVEEQWARQPYHAAENLEPDEARDLVRRGVEAAHRMATQEMREAIRREEERQNDVTGCAVLVGSPMPDWSVDDILAVHLRMHKAEGVLFREALVEAAKRAGLRLIAIPEKLLMTHAENALQTRASHLVDKVRTLGKAVGPPWGRDQKDASLAAMIALPRK